MAGAERAGQLRAGIGPAPQQGDGQRTGHGEDQGLQAPRAELGARVGQQPEPQCDVAGRGQHQADAHARQRDQHVRHQQHAGDRAHGIGRIQAADPRLAGATAQQRQGEQRQRHPGEERGRQHHRQRDAGAAQQVQAVATVGARQCLHQRRAPVERSGIGQQRQQGGHAHRHLGQGRGAQRVMQARRAALHPGAAKGQAEQERAQHQLEAVHGGPQHLVEQADPADFVDE